MEYPFIKFSEEYIVDSPWSRLIFSLVNVIVFYIGMYFFVFLKYSIVCDFLLHNENCIVIILNVDIRHMRRFNVLLDDDLNKLTHYSHFTWINVFYFGLMLLFYGFAMYVDGHFAILFNLLFIVMILFFSYRFDDCYNLLNRLVDIKYIRDKLNVINDRLNTQIVDLDNGSDNASDNTIDSIDNPEREFDDVAMRTHADNQMFYMRELEYKKYCKFARDDIVSGFFMSLFISFVLCVMVFLSLMFVSSGLVVYLDDNGHLVAYDIIPNYLNEKSIEENGFIKFCIRVDVRIRLSFKMHSRGIYIEFTVTKGKNDDYDINYVVFENGVKVDDKFNLKRFKRGDSLIDIVGKTESDINILEIDNSEESVPEDNVNASQDINAKIPMQSEILNEFEDIKSSEVNI
jgi:hypothetical protein